MESWLDRLAELDVRDDSSQQDDLGYDDGSMLTNGEQLVLSHLVRSGDTVFDVGACRGQWTQSVLQVRDDIAVHAFEPIPSIFDGLQRSLKESSVSCHNIAMHDSSGPMQIFHYNASVNVEGMSSFYRRVEAEKQLGTSPAVVDVDSTTVDEFCERQGVDRVHVMKIDTEGAELAVLRGARQMLARGSIGIIQFEYGGTYPDAGITLRQVVELLWSHHYVIHRIVPKGLLRVLTWRDALENFRYSNYLAVLLSVATPKS